MPDNLKDILSNLNNEIDQEKLMLYLQDKLSREQKHEMEKQLLDNDFENDALEGLQEIRDQQQITLMVDMLNRDLKKKTAKTKKRREKMKLPDMGWIYISIVIIILLVIISYILVRRSMHH